jgi:hypothetical protein
MKIILFVVSAMMLPVIGLAQSGGERQVTEEERVKEVVVQLFKAMHTGDSAVARSVFHESVTMATAFRNRDNQPVLRKETSIDDFMKMIGTPRPEPVTEEIWNVDVKIDGDFAQLWCDYALYVGKRFNHCGVDAFHLHKSEKGWKIFHLADTRKTVGCNVPVEISDKYK